MKKNRILFVIGYPLSQGGHINSVITFSKYLIKKDIAVAILSANGGKVPEFKNIGGVFYSNENRSKFISFFKILKVVFEFKPSIVIFCDYAALKQYILFCLFTFKKNAFIIAGGEVPSYKLPPFRLIIVFSRELLETLKSKYSERKFFLIKERIDTDFFKFKERSNSKKHLKIFMSMRIDSSKKKWLDNIFNLVNELNSNSFTLRIAGFGNMFKEYSKKVNQSKLKNSIQLLGRIDDSKLLREEYYNADIVIGHGRGILEAMSCGRPVIILGENGELELVTNNMIDMAEYYNFSGRHFRQYEQRNYSLKEVLNSVYLMPEIGKWNREYITREYDASLGVTKLLDSFKFLKYNNPFEWMIWIIWRKFN